MPRSQYGNAWGQLTGMGGMGLGGSANVMRPIQFTPTMGLAELIQSQNALMRLMNAGGGGRGVGGGGAVTPGGEGDPRFGRWVTVPKADGTTERVWVEGKTKSAQDKAAEAAINTRAQEIVNSDPELKQELANISGLSIEGQKERLDHIRKNIIPRLAKVTGTAGENIMAATTAQLDKDISARQTAFNQSGVFDQIVDAARRTGNKFMAGLKSITAADQERVAIGQAAEAEDEKLIRNNVFLDEQRRREAEGRSNASLMLSNPVRTAVSMSGDLVTAVAPAIAGGALGTAMAGPVGGLAGLALGGGIPSAIQSGGEAVMRAATDANIEDADRAQATGEAFRQGTAWGGVIGGIPWGPSNAIRAGVGALARRGAAREVAKVAAGETGEKLAQATATRAAATRAAVGPVRPVVNETLESTINRSIDANAARVLAGERLAAYDANAQSFLRGYPLRALDLGTLGGAFQVGQNYAYGNATGQDIPLTEGIGEQLLTGAVLGLPFGARLPGRRSLATLRAEAQGIPIARDTGTVARPTEKTTTTARDRSVLNDKAYADDAAAMHREFFEEGRFEADDYATYIRETLAKEKDGGKATRLFVTEAIESGRLGRRAANDLAGKFNKKTNERDGIEAAIKRAKWPEEVDNVTGAGDGSEPDTSMGQSKSTGEGGLNTANPFTGSAGTANPTAAPRSTADADSSKIAGGNTTPQGRGDAGATPQSTGAPEATPTTPDQQRIGGTEGANGKSDISTAAAGRPATDTGQRSAASSSNAGTGKLGDAEAAGWGSVNTGKRAVAAAIKRLDAEEAGGNALPYAEHNARRAALTDEFTRQVNGYAAQLATGTESPATLRALRDSMNPSDGSAPTAETKFNQDAIDAAIEDYTTQYPDAKEDGILAANDENTVQEQGLAETTAPASTIEKPASTPEEIKQTKSDAADRGFSLGKEAAENSGPEKQSEDTQALLENGDGC